MRIAVINQKGGVGKSTIAVNLSYQLAIKHLKTLLVDLDPQGHSSEIFRVHDKKDEQYPKSTIRDFFNGDMRSIIGVKVPAYVTKGNKSTEVPWLDVVHSDIFFSKTAEQICSKIHREKILHAGLTYCSSPIENAFNYNAIILDCPPTLNVITVNAIYTADVILIPITADRGALDGMGDLFETIREVKERRDFTYFIIENCYDVRNRQTNNYIENQLNFYSNNVLATKIRKCEAINQARIVGEPLMSFDAKSKGQKDYDSFSEELLSCLPGLSK